MFSDDPVHVIASRGKDPNEIVAAFAPSKNRDTLPFL